MSPTPKPCEPVKVDQKPEWSHGCSTLTEKIPRRWSTISAIIVVENDVNMIQNHANVEVPGSLSGPGKLENEKHQTFLRRYLGIFLTILSCALFGICTIITKILPMHPVNLAFYRSLGLLIPSLIIIPLHHACVKKSTVLTGFLALTNKERWVTTGWLCMRGSFGIASVILLFCSIKYISVADVSVLGFSTPIIIVFLAYFILREPLSIVQLCTCFIALIGVFIISRPPFLTGAEGFDMITLIGVGFAVGSMGLMAVVLILLRFLRQTHYLLITFVFGVWGCFLSLSISFGLDSFRLPQGPYEWLLIGCLAVATFFGQTCLTLALKYEQSGVVSLVRCLDVIFAFVFQFIFLGTMPDWYSVIGAVIIISAVLLICMRKFLLELPAEASLRKKLWFLTK